MKCPVDNATLLITDRSGIEIDYCPECRGVWLDRGELDKLVQGASRAESQYEERGRYRDHDDDRDRRGSYDGGKHHKKKESFIGDLFDF